MPNCFALLWWISNISWIEQPNFPNMEKSLSAIKGLDTMIIAKQIEICDHLQHTVATLCICCQYAIVKERPRQSVFCIWLLCANTIPLHITTSCMKVSMHVPVPTSGKGLQKVWAFKPMDKWSIKNVFSVVDSGKGLALSPFPWEVENIRMSCYAITLSFPITKKSHKKSLNRRSSTTSLLFSLEATRHEPKNNNGQNIM